MCPHLRICLVLLIGIPGSGKSFFRKFLEEYFKVNIASVLGHVKMYSVSYDDFSKVRNPSQMMGDEKWRDERLKILKFVENIIINLKENDCKNFISLVELVSVINGNINPDCILVLIDDNMYYKSMRYEYFRLARAYCLSFCQIYFDITLQEAITCNITRNAELQVPNCIIETMLEKIEPPQKSNSWETYSVSVTSHSNFEDECILDIIFSCIRDALENSAKPNVVYANKEGAQQITHSNALHQIDNTLKQLVSVFIKKEIKENKNNDIHTISQSYSDKRLTLLKQIKEKSVVLPINLCNTINHDDIDQLKPILSNLLQK